MLVGIPDRPGDGQGLRMKLRRQPRRQGRQGLALVVVVLELGDDLQRPAPDPLGELGGKSGEQVAQGLRPGPGIAPDERFGHGGGALQESLHRGGFVRPVGGADQEMVMGGSLSGK